MRRILLAGILVLLSTASFAKPKLYIFDCGYFKFDDVTAFGLTNDETPVREMFVPCYLVEHTQGRLLWDGGLPLPLVGQGRQEQSPGVTVEYQRSLIDQLADLDLQPEEVDYIAFSHFHFDHAGAANAFTGSQLLIQQTEYDAAFMHPEDNPIFDPVLYDALASSPKTLLNGDYDVFGDGSVRIISARGHTPGHQTLLLNLPNTGKVMLSGDLYHFEASRRLRRTPEFNTNKEQTLQSMDKIESMLQAENATLWIEHNKALADTQKKSTQFYD